MCDLYTTGNFCMAYIFIVSLTSQIVMPLKLMLHWAPCNNCMIWRVSNMHVQFALRSKWLSWVMPFDLIHAFSCNEANGMLSFPTRKKEIKEKLQGMCNWTQLIGTSPSGEPSWMLKMVWNANQKNLFWRRNIDVSVWIGLKIDTGIWLKSVAIISKWAMECEIKAYIMNGVLTSW